jgi:hypothetical protein
MPNGGATVGSTCVTEGTVEMECVAGTSCYLGRCRMFCKTATDCGALAPTCQLVLRDPIGFCIPNQ